MTSTAQLEPRQLGQLRQVLDNQRTATLESVAQLGFDIDSVRHSRRDSSTDDEHDPEGSTLAFEQSQSSALLTQARDRLQLVDGALARLGADAYGSCLVCGQPIGFARLTARPYTQHCIRCASEYGG